MKNNNKNKDKIKIKKDTDHQEIVISPNGNISNEYSFDDWSSDYFDISDDELEVADSGIDSLIEIERMGF